MPILLLFTLNLLFIDSSSLRSYVNSNCSGDFTSDSSFCNVDGFVISFQDEFWLWSIVILTVSFVGLYYYYDSKKGKIKEEEKNYIERNEELRKIQEYTSYSYNGNKILYEDLYKAAWEYGREIVRKYSDSDKDEVDPYHYFYDKKENLGMYISKSYDINGKSFSKVDVLFSPQVLANLISKLNLPIEFALQLSDSTYQDLKDAFEQGKHSMENSWRGENKVQNSDDAYELRFPDFYTFLWIKGRGSDSELLKIWDEN